MSPSQIQAQAATTQVAIIGGGLAGLYAACMLERLGTHDYMLLEARDHLGGRIQSINATENEPSEAGPDFWLNRFDLGPTWFWPDIQPDLAQVISGLGLERFAQHEDGDMMVERARGEPPLRMRGYISNPTSMRLVGGMAALIDALTAKVDPSRIMTGQTVARVSATPAHVELQIRHVSGSTTVLQADHMLLALPPRLAATTIDFHPPLPGATANQWRNTPTWMAPHAKYLAVYDAPFWREQDLSGEGRSWVGPMAEIHDASMPGGKAALFGFLGIPAQVRTSTAPDTLKALCRAQLERLFGPDAAKPQIDFIKDWARDHHTATPADLDGDNAHIQNAPSALASIAPWNTRLTGIASEWSPLFAGYLAGAIDAATRGVKTLAAVRQTNRQQ